jgi:ABC transport system ATP-binding/permease protein
VAAAAAPGRRAEPAALPGPPTPRERSARRRPDGELRKLRQRLEEVERRIAEVETRLEALAATLAAPDLYRDADRARAAVSEQKNAQQEVAWLLREWEDLSTELADRA